VGDDLSSRIVHSHCSTTHWYLSIHSAILGTMEVDTFTSVSECTIRTFYLVIVQAMISSPHSFPMIDLTTFIHSSTTDVLRLTMEAVLSPTFGDLFHCCAIYFTQADLICFILLFSLFILCSALPFNSPPHTASDGPHLFFHSPIVLLSRSRWHLIWKFHYDGILVHFSAIFSNISLLRYSPHVSRHLLHCLDFHHAFGYRFHR